MTEVTKDILKTIYPPRPLDSRKYDHGLVIVIGGSEFYSGSPALSALAAFRSGADMVRVIAPKRAADIIASFSPIMAAYPLPGECLKKEHLPTLIAMAESAKVVSRGKAAVVIGGGIGRSQEIQETIREFLTSVTLPVVVDADAIHCLDDFPQIFANKPFLLTPHSYEFFLLTKKEVQDLPLEEKIKIVEAEALRLQTTILLKGKTDIISNGQETALSNTGAPHMAVGGAGDTLAGIAGAILARGRTVFEAGCGAAFINGKAGEIAAKRLGESLVATDIIDAISEVLKP